MIPTAPVPSTEVERRAVATPAGTTGVAADARTMAAARPEGRGHGRPRLKSGPWPRQTITVLLLALAVQVALALPNRDLRAAWTGVPSAPPAGLAALLTLGDPQWLYRQSGLELQNMGDQGGTVTPLSAYDYGRLADWLAVLDQIDPEADYLPTLAGFYFSQTPEPADLRRVIAYLVAIGARNPGRNWRWLAHGVYLARHRLDDPALALEIASHLATVVDPSVPVWVRQLPAFALAEVGERQAARDLFAAILATDPNLAADEVVFMRAFIDGDRGGRRAVGDS